MADYQAVTQGIRAYLRSGTRRFSDDLPDLAAGYAALCREANLRLRRCVEYARRGAIPEAAHLAACQPDLVRLVSALQFPEWKDWAEACAAHGLPGPPALLDGLDEVKAALAREPALGPLLARHRLLALAKAPVARRLAVVRLLATHDPENPTWAGERRRLEPSRLAELSADAARARRAGDAEALRAVAAELSDHDWVADLPDDLSEVLEVVGRDRRRAEAAAELKRLAGELKSLPSTGPGDAAASEAAVGRWQALREDYPDLVDAEAGNELDAAVARWRSDTASRLKAEEAQLQGRLFKPADRVGQDLADAAAARRRRLGQTVIAVLLSGLAVAAVLIYFNANPDSYERIRSFLVGGR